jgi:putative ABC transport system permease protein
MRRPRSDAFPGFHAIAVAVRDVRHAVRALAHNPGFSAVAVLMLALGLGAATAMFTVVDSVLVRPLPYPDADRVVSIATRYLPESGYDFPRFDLSGPELIDYRAQTRAFEQIAGYVRQGALVESGTGGESVRVGQVLGTPNLFTVLGVQPEIGRGFLAAEGEPGAACVIVLSHGLWLEAFGGNPSAVGGVARIGGQPCQIAGVMPAGFVFPDSQARLWRNLVLDQTSPFWGRLNHNFSAVGRLARGVTLAQAEAETKTLMAAWAREEPHYKGHFVFLRPLLEDLVGDVRPELTLLLTAVAFVLVIICANLASLMLARGEARRREVGLRLALGVTRARLVVHLLAESLVLAAVGGALGFVFAVFILDGLVALYPGTLPRADAISIDWRAFAFAAVATGGSALLFGLVPALRAASTSPGIVLRSLGRGAVGLAGRAQLMRVLVVAEVALSVMLVASAGLLLRSYSNLSAVDLGFDADGAYTVAQALPSATYPDNDSVRAFYASLLDRVSALPGVQSAGAISSLPLTGGTGARDDFAIEGRPDAAPGEQRPNAGYVMVTPGYFEALRIPVRAGRAIEATDARGAPWVAVINETAAKRFWPGANPLGRRIRYRSSGDERWITIVGVVADTRVNGPRSDAEPQVFVPHAQMPRETSPGRSMTIVVRPSGDAAAVVPAVRSAILEADRALPLIGGRFMVDIVGDSVGQPRFTTELVTFFAVVALLLGVLGIYGVLSYVVAQRGGEFGVRIALGAPTGKVLRLVVGQGMGLTSIGAAIGIGGALTVARVFRGVLFGVGPFDVVSLSVAVVVFGAAAFAACCAPAWRAARIDPITALRAE